MRLTSADNSIILTGECTCVDLSVRVSPNPNNALIKTPSGLFVQRTDMLTSIITLNAGSNVSIPEAATQQVLSNPVWTINVNLPVIPPDLSSKTVSLHPGDNISIVGTETQLVTNNPSWIINADINLPDPLIFQKSITQSGDIVNLVNDADTPGNLKYYGTNTGGVKGFFDLPGGGGANRVEALQETCDTGHTTTTSIIIGSSVIAHSGLAGQLVQGVNSTASLAATNGVALNAGTTTGVNATALNSGTASGPNSLAGGASTASNDRSFAAGANNTASGFSSIALGGFNTVSGSYAFSGGESANVSGEAAACFGYGGTNAARYSITLGRSNDSPAGASAYCESNVLIGVANTTGLNARGCAAIGALNTPNKDFSTCIGYGNASEAKGSVSMGSGAKTTTYGEVAICTTQPFYQGKSTNVVGMNQLSILTYVNHDTGGGNEHALFAKICSDTAGNAQSCGSEDPLAFGLTYYQVDDNTMHYVAGRLIGINSSGNITVWTIDTWFKNIGGVMTSGTTAFTSVQKDAAFTNMDTCTLVFATTTGNLKSLKIGYHNTSTYPVAEYQCTLFISKLIWKA